MNALYSLYAWIIWILHLLILGPVALLATLIAPKLGFYAIKGVATSGLFLTGIRVTVRGREKVDWSRPHVFMGNHQNLLDPFALVLAVPVFMVGIEKKENQRIPVYGWISRAWGNLPIDRSNPGAARETIALAVERFKEGTSVAILPEGTRTKDGSIGPFKKGGFHLAVGAGADIVPFTFNGAFERLKTGSWRVFPGTIQVEFGAAISTAGYDKENLDELVERVRGAVCANFQGERLRREGVGAR